MTLLHDAVDAKKFDVRLQEKNLTRGVITDAEIAKQVNSLPDDSDNADYTSLEDLGVMDLDSDDLDDEDSSH